MRESPAFARLLTLLLLTGLAGTAAAQIGDCDPIVGTLPDPTCDCASVDGDSSGNITDYWEVDLEAGKTYTFTFCNSTCSAATSTFDTILSVYEAGCTNLLGTNDNACGLLSELVVTTSVSGTHVVEVDGFFNDAGPYTLAYREGGTAPSCSETNGALPTATTDCQLLSDELCAGDDAYYTIDLTTGFNYTFTLCDSTCPGADAPFDSRLELFAPGGLPVASNGDFCGDDGQLSFSPVPPDGDGTYCLRVQRESGSDSDFTLGWFVDCVEPMVPTLAPDSGNTSGETCEKDVFFVATTFGTGPFDWEWTIVPDAGNAAMPDTFMETTDGLTSVFPTTLTGDGLYDVSVTVSNECGTETNSLTYMLEDLRGPDLTCSAEPCPPDPVPAPDGAAAEAVAAPGPSVRAMAQVESEAQTWSPPRQLDLAAIKEAMMSAAEPGLARERVAAKLDISPERVLIRDGREPDLRRPPMAAAVSCPAPCTIGTLEATHPFYDVYLDCNNGAFTARTGASHSVTVGSGGPQNVIFGGEFGNPGTSDISFRVHDSGTTYRDPTGGEACAFDPPDTPVEPSSTGLEAEWSGVSPLPGVTLTLREEIVAFGDIEANSGIRLTLGASNDLGSSQPVTMGVRWQIDYENGSDDGPLYARVRCDPFEVFDERSTEHEFDILTEVDDFYRIQNNSGSPIFANFTSTASIAGFPDTATPDRLVYGRWGSLNASPWNYLTNEGDNADGDSATLVYYGFDVADGITIAPGESFSRSVVIFTQGEEQDCGAFVPGEGVNANTQVCPGSCVSIGAEGVDNCSDATVTLVDSSTGAPPCVGNPCLLDFPDEGVFSYTWEATDAQGNSTVCVSTVTVVDDGSCNQPPSCQAGPDLVSGCREATIDAATAEDQDEDELSWEWTSSDPNVVLSPSNGILAAGPGDRAIPAVTATLDPSVNPCGVVATLTLTVIDPAGELSSCETTVTFDDTEPPSVAGNTDEPAACIWPANHRYVCIEVGGLDVAVSDSCTGASWRVTDCLSNQPDEAPDEGSDFNGDGNTENDCVISPDGSMVCVRAERAGGGENAQDGRTYTLLAVATDECGNESEPLPAATIHVPHDQSPAEREGCLDPTKVGLKKKDPFPWHLDSGSGDPGDGSGPGDGPGT